MSDVYKLARKKTWSDDLGRHTTWYLLDERGVCGFYIDHVKWSDGVMDYYYHAMPESECMAFRYNSKKGGVTNWGELEVVYDMKPQQAFETICKRLGIKVTYILG